MTSPDRHAEIRRLFLASCARPEEDRARFLSEACRSDLDLRKQVEALLAYHTERSLSSQGGASSRVRCRTRSATSRERSSRGATGSCPRWAMAGWGRSTVPRT